MKAKIIALALFAFTALAVAFYPTYRSTWAVTTPPDNTAGSERSTGGPPPATVLTGRGGKKRGKIVDKAVAARIIISR